MPSLKNESLISVENNPFFSLIPEKKRALFQIPPPSSERYRYSHAILLDENENPYNLFGNRYFQNRFAEPGQIFLKERLKTLWNEDSFLITHGEWEGLDWLFKLFANPEKSKLLLPESSPASLKILAYTYHIEVSTFPIHPKRGIDYTALKEHIQQLQPNFLFIGNPDNPYGYLMDTDFIFSLLRKHRMFVIVDESFIEFASPSQSIISEIKQFPYLIVKRSFSYAYALAGLNLSVYFFHPELLELLTRLIPFPHLSRIASQFLYEAVEDFQRAFETIRYIQEQREWIKSELNHLPFVEYVTPSQGNYLFVQFKDNEQVYHHLLKHKILTKLYPNGIRISIGNESENKALIKVLRKLLT